MDNIKKLIEESKLTKENLLELKEHINKKIEAITDNKLIVYTHKCIDSSDYHKRKYKHWTKLVNSIDITKTNGYAFLGEFLNINKEHKLKKDSIIVEVCDLKIVAYRINEEITIIAEAQTNKMSNFIEILSKEF